MFQPNELPVYEKEGLWAKVIIGTAFGLTSPVSSRWPINYLHVKLAPYQTNTLEMQHPGWQGFIYIVEGRGRFGEKEEPAITQQCLILK